MSDQYGSNDPNQYGGNPGQYGEAPGQYGGGSGQYGGGSGQYGAPPPNGPQQPFSNGGQGPGDGFSAGVNESKGFFGALFDFSFTHFVTPMIVKVVYILVTIGLALGWLILTISGFTQSAGAGILILIGGALGALIYLALIRMTLEFYVSIVRMSEDIHKRLPGG